MVKAALTKLAPKNRLVIQMYYFDQLTLQEIADILEESVNTIKSRFRRALFTLKNDLSLKK
jgi:RNA polymerase sigma-70 factor (ECF subfamily)